MLIQTRTWSQTLPNTIQAIQHELEQQRRSKPCRGLDTTIGTRPPNPKTPTKERKNGPKPQPPKASPGHVTSTQATSFCTYYKSLLISEFVHLYWILYLQFPTNTVSYHKLSAYSPREHFRSMSCHRLHPQSHSPSQAPPTTKLALIG